MAQLIAVPQQADQVRALFKVNHDRLLRAAPKGADPTRLLTVAFNTIVYDSKLVQCTRESLFGGVMEALKMGLSIGGPMQEAWLLPFRNKKGDLEATMIVGYQGYRVLVDRAKSVIALHPRAVYANDDFDVEFGTNTHIRHKPYWMLGHPEPGPLIAVYAVANLRGGGVQVEVLPKREIDEHRARSRAKDAGPWVTDYDAMALKTAIRKICKYLPKAAEAAQALARALQIDDRTDRGEDIDYDVTGLVLDAPAEIAAPGAKQIGSSAVEELKKTLKHKAEPKPAPPAEHEPSEAEVEAQLAAAMAKHAQELEAERAAIVADGAPAPKPKPQHASKLEKDLFDKPFE